MGSTSIHEIRDAVHVFDHLDSEERKVLDSRPFQRLRHIHQLAMTYLVYPGATHRRFEHSLGVMELAARVYDTITAERNRESGTREVLPGDEDQIRYWRRVLRMAALCHDIGHLPFSHAAEERLLPDGMSHERMSVDLIRCPEMEKLWRELRPPLNSVDIAKLAVGPRKYPKDYDNSEFTDWERILSEIIVGDSFGVDRMDYLLRDSLHAGVVYGKFDQYRLIDTLRVLPDSEDALTPVLGIESGGLESAEALLLARYFMYSQVYFHPVRRAYDLHLQRFLIDWLGANGVPTDVEAFLRLTDDEVLVEIRKATSDTSHPGHVNAKRITERKHFKVLYERNASDVATNPQAAKAVFDAARQEFGDAIVEFDSYRQKQSGTIFPVKLRDGRILSSVAESEVLARVPVVAIEYVFVAPEKRDEAKTWLEQNRHQVIAPKSVEGDEE